jgi:hypothetical protein
VLGPYPTFIEGFQNYTDSIGIAVALKNCPVLNLLFQNLEEFSLTLQIGAFQFILQQPVFDIDEIYHYDVRLGGLEVSVVFMGVDSVPCVNYSNVDFVNFVWHNLDVYSFRKHALTILPDPSPRRKPLLFLQYYRAANMGWNVPSGCVRCVDTFRFNIRPLTSCIAHNEACSSNIGRRQPPSLKVLASYTLFKFTCN